jgi:dUTP pyrophosphatase
MQQIQIKKLREEAILPYKAHATDAGHDLFAAEEVTVLPGESALIGTGFAMALPEGTEAQLRPRSGIALKHQVTLLNSPGTIDADYRGEVKIILINHGKEPFHVTAGMKIAQMVIAPVLASYISEVAELDDTQRGEGGFGSTGQ